MEYDPFNEVDNLLFAQLSYIDFDGIVPTFEEGKSISLQEAYEKYYQIHTREEILERKSFVKMCVFLMDDMVSAIRYQDIRLGGFVNEYDEEKVKQMSAIYFELPDESIYVAYRGTDESVTGWKEDFLFSYIHGTSGQKAALSYLQACLNRFENGSFRVGGHSKGGNFALYASLYVGLGQDKIHEIWCNDSPGMMEEVYQEKAYLNIKDKIRCIIPKSSLVGVLMSSPAKAEVVESSEKGIMQHDGNTWQIEGNHFVKLEHLSHQGRLNDLAISSWLKQVSEKDRQQFIEIIFSILEDIDIHDFRQLNENFTKWLPALNDKIKDLSKQEQAHVKEMILQLIKSYWELGMQNYRQGEGSKIKSLLGLSKSEEESDVVGFLKELKEKWFKG